MVYTYIKEVLDDKGKLGVTQGRPVYLKLLKVTGSCSEEQGKAIGSLTAIIKDSLAAETEVTSFSQGALSIYRRMGFFIYEQKRH